MFYLSVDCAEDKRPVKEKHDMLTLHTHITLTSSISFLFLFLFGTPLSARFGGCLRPGPSSLSSLDQSSSHFTDGQAETEPASTIWVDSAATARIGVAKKRISQGRRV